MKSILMYLCNLLFILSFFMVSMAINGCGMGEANMDANEPVGVYTSAGIVHSRGYGVSRKEEPVDSGILTAREAAYTIAMSNLLEYIVGSQIESKTEVKNTKLAENEVSRSVQGMLKNILILKEGIVQIKKKQVVYFVEVGVNMKTIGKQ
ncbi:hypothetical protein FJZ33_07840 [Candidatus Poribacteria bacterium]|nr:hypothetical protein [Candidatus Poribacteria bacterium]